MPTTDDFNIYYSDTSTPWSQAQESAIQASSIENALSDVRFGANLMFERYIDMTNYDVDKLTYGQRARVYNDSIDTNNGEYVWKGASWALYSMNGVIDLSDPDQRPSGWRGDSPGGGHYCYWGMANGMVQITMWLTRDSPVVFHPGWNVIFEAGYFPPPLSMGYNVEFTTIPKPQEYNVAISAGGVYLFRWVHDGGNNYTLPTGFWFQSSFTYLAVV
jgi:hypothetical protein